MKIKIKCKRCKKIGIIECESTLTGIEKDYKVFNGIRKTSKHFRMHYFIKSHKTTTFLYPKIHKIHQSIKNYKIICTLIARVKSLTAKKLTVSISVYKFRFEKKIWGAIRAR